jgi:sugar lactone lactonase YvrE
VLRGARVGARSRVHDCRRDDRSRDEQLSRHPWVGPLRYAKLGVDMALPKTHLVSQPVSFPECPRWRDGRLWFTDMFAQRVCTLDSAGQLAEVATVPGNAGGLGWLPDGQLVVASMESRRILRLNNGADELEEYVDLTDLTDGPINDMLVTRAGGIYVGNFGAIDTGPAAAGPDPRTPTRLVYVDPRGSARHVGGELLFPNAIVLSGDGAHLSVAETYAARITTFSVEPDGSLTEQYVLHQLEAPAHPDGCCIDAQDAIWAASPTTGVVRIDASGVITDRIDVKATACALGGDDGRTLFLLGSHFNDFDEIYRLEARGFIQSVRVTVPAQPASS